MRKLFALCITLFTVGCASQPQAIIVRQPVYTVLPTPTETLQSPKVNIVERQVSPAHYNQQTYYPTMRDDVRMNATYRRNEPSGYQAMPSGSEFARAALRNPIQAISGYSQKMHNRAFSHRDQIGYSDSYRREYDDVSERRTYHPHQSGATVQYIPVMIVSVTKAAEQCDYTSEYNPRISGTEIPTWLDPRDPMAKQLHPTMRSHGDTINNIDCRDGGYTVTYVGTHPRSGAQFSGTFAAKRPPKSAYLNLPFSLNAL